jgi:hypothetical protein
MAINLNPKNQLQEIVDYCNFLETKQEQLELFVRDIAKFQQEIVALVNVLAEMLVEKEVLLDEEIKKNLDLRIKKMNELNSEKLKEIQKDYNLQRILDGDFASS